jgi:hypothetical protein
VRGSAGQRRLGRAPLKSEAMASALAAGTVRSVLAMARSVRVVHAVAVSASAPARSMSFWDGVTSRLESYRSGQQAKKSGEWA